MGIWILGGGGHAKVAIATLEAAGQPIAGIYDDDLAKIGTHLLGHPVQGVTPPGAWWKAQTRTAFIAIGNNQIRERVAALKVQWAVAQHPAAIVHSSVQVGPGSLICAGVVVQPDTQIGAHVIANTSCSIDHDCIIGDFAHVAPGAHLAGGVTLGARTFVGTGASILPGVRIGSDVAIGAGAVVRKDVPDGETWIGVPARPKSNKA
ncbi:MAG: acetyltransferase [Parvibaculum sp.]